jgi:uncharacterized membrane protein YeaQ/YmgE (transglycosylase-associated protein family)
MISLLIWLVLGFVVGWLAKMIMPGNDGVLGIVGAVVGGLIGTVVGFPMVSSFDNIASSLPSLFSSVIGAIVVLALYRLLAGRSVTA